MTQDEAIQSMMDSSDEALQASTDDYVKELLYKWSEFTSRLEADILKIHSGLPEDATYADFVQFQGDAKISSAIAQQLEKLHVSVETERMDSLIDQYKDAYNASAWTVDEATPPSVDIEYNLGSDDQIRTFVMADWPNNMFVTRNAQELYFMAQDIKKQVTLAMLQGQSVQELSKSIQDVIGDEDSDYKYRATRIARTELLRAAGLGRKNLFAENDDVIDDEVWLTRALGDGRLCEGCANREGMTITQIENGEVGRLGYPVDEDDWINDYPAPCHPNGGCTTRPKIKSMEELLGPELSKGITNFDQDEPMSFSSWANKYLSAGQRGNL